MVLATLHFLSAMEYFNLSARAITVFLPIMFYSSIKDTVVVDVNEKLLCYSYYEKLLLHQR